VFNKFLLKEFVMTVHPTGGGGNVVQPEHTQPAKQVKKGKDKEVEKKVKSVSTQKEGQKVVTRKGITSVSTQVPGKVAAITKQFATVHPTPEKKAAEVSVKPGHVQEIHKKLEEKASSSQVSQKTAETGIRPGLVKEKKTDLGQKKPDVVLGGGVNVTPEQIERHRNPTVDGKLIASTALTEKYMNENLKELKEKYKGDHQGKDPDPRDLAKLKEQANQTAFDQHMSENIKAGIYNPSVIAAEMRKVLEVGDEIPGHIDDIGDAMKAISKELDQFNIPKFAKKEGISRKQSQVLTNELRQHLENDIKETMKQYKTVYPEKSYEDAFVFCRDLARSAVYQVIYDKQSFTGSDHGVLHVHHNCEHGEKMHEHMEEGDMSDKARLLSRIMHFYHDIGYSVGASNFTVMKDHPFIGASFIEANREYFEKYLGPDETDIIKTSILYHAIVSFDSKLNDDLAMVRFTTSNSDACAVTSDQKTQSFWREHPETLLPLAKLRQFLTIFPEYAGRDKLSSSDIIDHPEKVFKLKKQEVPPLLTEENFESAIDFKAWTVFSGVRAELMEIAQHQRIPEDEKQAFMEAIKTNFNAFSGDVVLAQYGAELNDVSVVLNPETSGPKYLPAIDMSPSILFAFLQSMYSNEVAGKNIRKLGCEEYAAKPEEIDKALDQVGNNEADSVQVPSPVAQLTISKQTEKAKGKLLTIETTLKGLQAGGVSFETRRAVGQTIDVMHKMSKGEKNLVDFQKSVTNLYGLLERTEVEGKLETILDKFIAEITTEYSETPMPKEKYNEYILALRAQCSNENEWKMLGLESPLSK
jgi:hypothetical protein